MATISRRKTIIRKGFIVTAFYVLCSTISLHLFFVKNQTMSSGSGCLSDRPEPPGGSFFRINRIYYLNTFVATVRNQMMQGWLSAQHIPFFRIEALAGAVHPRCFPLSICHRNTRAMMAYTYLFEYGGFEPAPCQPTELKSRDMFLSFGQRPQHTNGRPYYDLSGTTLILHKDNIVIPQTDQLERHLADAIQCGQIALDWEVIRIKCCRAQNSQENNTSSNFSSWRPHLQPWDQEDSFFEAILWKDTALQRLFRTMGITLGTQSTMGTLLRLDRFVASNFRSYNQEVCFCVRQATEKDVPVAVRTTVLPQEKKISLQRIQQQTPLSDVLPPRKIERVYYSNLDKNVLRKNMMEFWLNQDKSRTIPYKRIAAHVGDTEKDQCVEDKNATKRCQGVAGLARTLLHILTNETMNGTSLILEDDFFITDPAFKRMEASIALVPDDWDVIRFDCRDIYDQVDLKWLSPFVAKSNEFRHQKNCTRCFFCGGTHAMLVREESTERLKRMWGQTPFDDVDCIIGRTKWINSYCVNIGAGDMFNFAAERSDIPKD